MESKVEEKERRKTGYLYSNLALEEAWYVGLARRCYNEQLD